MSFKSFQNSSSMISRHAMAIALGTAILSTPFVASADATSEQIQQLQMQIDALKKQINAAPAAAPSTKASPLAADGTLTVYGVTLYGTIDAGVSAQSHGMSYNADSPQGVSEPWNKNGNKSTINVTPGGASQSKLGIKGKEELVDGFYGIFQLETGINPVSGTLANGAKSLVDQNGIQRIQQTYSTDSSRSGQTFNGPAFVGVQNATYGQLTLGRHNTVMNDTITANDPMGGAYAFSAFTGSLVGGGNTQNARMDQSIKYNVQYGPVRFAAIYQPSGNTGIAFGHDEGYQAGLGFTQSIFTADLLYAVKKDAISLSSNSTPSSQALSATLSNTYTAAIMGTVDLKPVKLFAGYQQIKATNPDRSSSLTNDPFVLEGYQVTSVTTNSYNTNRILYVPWVGASYWVIPKLKLTAAGYLQAQNNYSGFGQSDCMTRNSTKCAGHEFFVSGQADYVFNKRFDVYAGIMYTKVESGMYVSSTAYHNNNMSPVIGGRFQF